jgi:hypothetical protein
MSLDGFPIVISHLLPTSRDVYVAPKNRREWRKRKVIAARRRRRGLAAPKYTKRIEASDAVMIAGTLYVSPHVYAKLIADCQAREIGPGFAVGNAA